MPETYCIRYCEKNVVQFGTREIVPRHIAYNIFRVTKQTRNECIETIISPKNP